MAVIGNSSTQQAFTPAIDYFSGTGSAVAFTLSRPVASVAQVQVVIDNVAQNPSSAYTVSSNTITFTSAPLSGTNNIYVYYTSPITQVIAPGQGTVGTTALATSPTITTPTLVTPNITTGLLLTSAAGTSGQFLTSAGSGSAPTWTTVASSQWTTSGSNIYYATGSVGIGTTSPFSTAGATTLSIGGTSSSTTGQIFLRDASGNNTVQIYRSGGGYNEFDSQTELHLRTESGAMRFSTANTEAMRIDSSGNLLVGTTSTSETTGVGLKMLYSTVNPEFATVQNTASGNATYVYYNTNATNNGYRFYVTANGGVNNYSGNNTNLSDERTKTNITLADNYLDKICAIPVKTFNYKDEPSGEQKTLGLIAQDVQQIAPEFVNSDGKWEAPEGESPLLSIYSTDMMFALMKSIQELKAINDTQAETINALTARIEALERK